jgi:hypothetical protein
LDLDLLLDILYGAIYMRFLIRHGQLSEEYIAEVCRLVLNGAAKNGRHSEHARTRKVAGDNGRPGKGSAVQA